MNWIFDDMMNSYFSYRSPFSSWSCFALEYLYIKKKKKDKIDACSSLFPSFSKCFILHRKLLQRQKLYPGFGDLFFVVLICVFFSCSSSLPAIKFFLYCCFLTLLSLANIKFYIKLNSFHCPWVSFECLCCPCNLFPPVLKN